MSIIEENWDFSIDLINVEKESYESFAQHINGVYETILTLLENGLKIQNYNYSGNFAQSQDEELKSVSDRNKELRNEIDIKVEELTRRKSQYASLKQDQKLLSQEIKETHEAFLMAKKYYKKYLKMYFTVESNKDEVQTIFVQFFTESKKENENYSLRLLRDTKTHNYELTEVNPRLKDFSHLKHHLQVTNDLPGLLCNIREAFLTIKNNKKH